MPNRSERGSMMVMALFVLALLGAVGIGLLFLTRTEVSLSQADVRGKQVYYFSEAGLEDGRTTIYEQNKASASQVDLTEELVAHAGPNGLFDFAVENLTPVYDADGRLTGFTGYGDDVPMRGVTAFGPGRYVAFVTNDPNEGVTTTTDVNQHVMMTGIGIGEGNRLEIVQALVHRPDAYPDLPATITVLGPDAEFEGGDSAAKDYVGDEGNPNCPGGDPNVHKPVVGVTGTDSKLTADDGVEKPLTYVSGGLTGTDTVSDLTLDPDMNPMWTDCEALVELAALVKQEADLVGDTSTPRASLGTPGAPKSVYIEGDYEIRGNWDGGGLLLVTGELTIDGMAGWYGPIFVIGKGDFLRDGAGNGNISGGVVVADVAGPDRVLFTGDDCSGEDDTLGTDDDGIAQSTYVVNGAGVSMTSYCGTLFPRWQGIRPFEIVSFRQR